MKECTLTLKQVLATQKKLKNLKVTTQKLISTYSLKQLQLKMALHLDIEHMLSIRVRRTC